MAVVEIGPAASRSLTENQSAFGPTVGVEVTPIENWLELEAGVTPLFRRHSTEWSVDLLFKKPWTLSDKTEFMLGVGPEWLFNATATTRGCDLLLSLVFWSSKRNHPKLEGHRVWQKQVETLIAELGNGAQMDSIRARNDAVP